jgi:hypothetical protein
MNRLDQMMIELNETAAAADAAAAAVNKLKQDIENYRVEKASLAIRIYNAKEKMLSSIADSSKRHAELVKTENANYNAFVKDQSQKYGDGIAVNSMPVKASFSTNPAYRGIYINIQGQVVNQSEFLMTVKGKAFKIGKTGHATAAYRNAYNLYVATRETRNMTNIQTQNNYY